MSSAHWVTEVFPPTFGFSFDEIEMLSITESQKTIEANKDKTTDKGKDKYKAKYKAKAKAKDKYKGKDKDDQEEEQQQQQLQQTVSLFAKEKPLSEFEKHLTHRVAHDDVSGIKNVYQRVWLMNRQKYEDALEQKNAVEAGFKDAETSTTDLAEYWEDDTIWTTAEISVLREVYKEAQRQNKLLSAQIRSQNEAYQKWKLKRDSEEEDLQTTTSQLHEVRKANQRYQIMCTNLKETVATTAKRVETLEREIQSLKRDKKEQFSVIHNQQKELDKEQFTRQRLEQDFQRKDRETRSKMKLQKDKLDIMHQRQINTLQKQVDTLQQALEEEVKEHQRTKKGLEVLRNHFSSLPYAGEEKKRNMVVTNQLDSWTTH